MPARESGARVLRRRVHYALAALALVMAMPLVSRAGGSAVSTDVTLLGDADGTGCAAWIQPAGALSFGALSPSQPDGDHVLFREITLRVVNGRDVDTSACTVTAGGASFMADGLELRSIHTLMLAQSPSSTVLVRLVPGVNEMARGESQAVLISSPATGGCAVITASLHTEGLPAFPFDTRVTGTLTLTLSDVAP
jgi:hypothetical protein